MKSHYYKILLFISLGLSLPIFAASPTTHLHDIDLKINKIKRAIFSNQSQSQQLQATLKKLELRINNQTQHLHQLNLKITHLQTTLRQLKTTYATYQHKIRQAQKIIAATLRADYQIGHQPRLNVLLRSQDITHTEIHLTYLQYLEKDRLTALQTLKHLLQLEQANIALQTKNIKLLEQAQHKTRQTLQHIEKLHTKREKLLSLINQTLTHQASTLKTLLTNKKHLESVILALNAKSPYFKAKGKPFSKLKHRLPWPTQGHLDALFGTQIEKSQLRWNGILFKATMGRPVHAVADGKVIFANWMPGYGLLLIIYHGQGYMTLYGRNQALFKRAGDTVSAGDEIALVGNSGGYKLPSLYFEIRHHSHAINPRTWLKSHF